ncbi:MAG: response regulator transcription factor [Verrucomicrobia bacterium]|nr:response regulator transcription factor [Verrucomicrobiota bacterium]
MGNQIRLTPPWRVSFVDDSQSTLEACSTLLATMNGFECVGAYLDASQALEAVPKSKPEIVVADIRMPGMDGLEFARRILGTHPAVKIIIYTAFADTENLRVAIELGVAGFLTKPLSASEFRVALQAAVHGTLCFSPGVRELLCPSKAEESTAQSDAGSLLTPRELELLRLYAKGKSYKEISDLLSISGCTVNSHFINIRAKLGVGSLIQAINRVFRPPPPIDM